MNTIPQRSRHLGMGPEELNDKPYARFWNPRMAPLVEHAREALLRGPVAPPLLLRLGEAPSLLEPGLQPLENGICFGEDGALRVAIRTEMPDVSPEMVDWWFGWHSEEPQRYKLWHPQAHVHAEWELPEASRGAGRESYLQRVSFVDEYIGSQLGRYAIQFIAPALLGLDESALQDPREQTAICARVGFADFPVDIGYLIHHVRRVPGGSEMRSRFWIGGVGAGGRGGNVVAGLAVHVARFAKKPTVHDGGQLLVHCSQEMNHLATFLPGLYAELGQGSVRIPRGAGVG
jgi:hypothetical protein